MSFMSPDVYISKWISKFIKGQKLSDVIVSIIARLLYIIILLKIDIATCLSKSIIYFNSLRYTILQFNFLNVFLINSTSQHSIINTLPKKIKPLIVSDDDTEIKSNKVKKNKVKIININLLHR